ncbi:MAG: NTP transferase domain-containing protein [Lachnospiraceae bacterium]|nr:NTP transferase domain-containing protein [Lachnospiraceae bacterium]
MKDLSREQFEILTFFCEEPGVSVANLPGKTRKMEKVTIEKTLSELETNGLICNGAVTEKGLQALEPYRVRRAVFLAAGFGTRLVPVTLNTPKPLVRVHGKRIIDGLLDAVIAAGIEEIYIVRGYLAEQFDQLLYKYPMVRFIENPEYSKTNNISSAIYAKEHLGNAYILESDLLLCNPKVIRKYHYCSNYLGCYKECSDDWCFTVKNGYISSQKIGGVNCYQEFGISYWDEETGRKLASDLKEVYGQPGGKDVFWDYVPFTTFPDRYFVEVCECNESDIIEIDSFQELKRIDKTYDV